MRARGWKVLILVTKATHSGWRAEKATPMSALSPSNIISTYTMIIHLSPKKKKKEKEKRRDYHM
jgi:hypothetical protein